MITPKKYKNVVFVIMCLKEHVQLQNTNYLHYTQSGDDFDIQFFKNIAISIFATLLVYEIHMVGSISNVLFLKFI
jgi:hypothetical protein